MPIGAPFASVRDTTVDMSGGTRTLPCCAPFFHRDFKDAHFRLLVSDGAANMFFAVLVCRVPSGTRVATSGS